VLGRIFITRPLFQETVRRLRADVVVDENPEDRVLSKAELIHQLAGMAGVIPLVTDAVDREVLQTAPSLKVVANFGVGVDHIDVRAATELGIVVTNTPGVLTETTADLAWSLLMASARRIVEADNFMRSTQFTAWGPKMLLGHDVYGKTLGIIGFGRIGQAIARRARGFNMKVIFTDAGGVKDNVVRELGVTRVSLEELLRASDYVTLHVPLVPQTTHLLDDRAFEMMKPSCIVINTSRGPVVDEKALVRALKNGRIAGAALDVFEREPQVEPELLEMNNVVLAPHIGSGSYETRLKMSEMAADNLLSVLKGQRPPNMVNPDVWDRRR
jgi:glyoxylate reductase